MNKKEIENFKLAALNFKNVCIDNETYFYITKNILSEEFKDSKLEIMTQLNLLYIGLYAKMFECTIWSGPKARGINDAYSIMVSNHSLVDVSVDIKTNQCWSPVFKLKDFDQMFKLKSFW